MSELTLPWINPIIPQYTCARYQNIAIRVKPELVPLTHASLRYDWIQQMRIAYPDCANIENEPVVSIALYAVRDSGGIIRTRLKPVYLHQAARIDAHVRWGSSRDDVMWLRFHPDCITDTLDLRQIRVGSSLPAFQLPPGFVMEPDELSACILDLPDRWYTLLVHSFKPAQFFWHDFLNYTGEPRANTGYIGIEMEAEFPSTRKRYAALAELMAYDYSMSGPVSSTMRNRSRASSHSHKLHCETDGSLEDNGVETVVMPHQVRALSTYVVHKQIWGILRRNGATNSEGRCGMHCHIGRSYHIALHRPQPAAILDLLTAAFLYGLQGMDSDEQRNLTGRDGVSRFASPTYTRYFNTSGTSERYRHINWNNQHTVEFRFIGVDGFLTEDWPCYAQDLIMALIDATDLLYRQYADRTSSHEGFKLVTLALGGNDRKSTENVKPHGRYARHVLRKVIMSAPEKYPYAALRFAEYTNFEMETHTAPAHAFGVQDPLPPMPPEDELRRMRSVRATQDEWRRRVGNNIMRDGIWMPAISPDAPSTVGRRETEFMEELHRAAASGRASMHEVMFGPGPSPGDDDILLSEEEIRRRRDAATANQERERQRQEAQSAGNPTIEGGPAAEADCPPGWHWMASGPRSTTEGDVLEDLVQRSSRAQETQRRVLNEFMRSNQSSGITMLPTPECVLSEVPT